MNRPAYTWSPPIRHIVDRDHRPARLGFWWRLRQWWGRR
jgi:hypothetical protein